MFCLLPKREKNPCLWSVFTVSSSSHHSKVGPECEKLVTSWEPVNDSRVKPEVSQLLFTASTHSIHTAANIATQITTKTQFNQERLNKYLFTRINMCTVRMRNANSRIMMWPYFKGNLHWNDNWRKQRDKRILVWQQHYDWGLLTNLVG